MRGGGRVLLFADPMLTRHSAFALGDRRRPQDVVLLSPILARWRLELQFDESHLFDSLVSGAFGPVHGGSTVRPSANGFGVQLDPGLLLAHAARPAQVWKA